MKKGLSISYIVIVLAFSAIYILPSVRIYFDYTNLAIITLAFYAFFIYKKENVKPIKNIVANLFPYMLLMFLVARNWDFKMGFLHPLLTSWCMLFPGVLCHNIIKRDNKIELYTIALFSLSLLLYVMNNTIGAFSESTDIMRELTASTMEDSLRLKYVMANIGGYGIAYGCGAVVVMLFTILVKHKFNTKYTFLLYAIIGYFSYFVLNAQFTTLLLLTIFCTILSIYYSDYGQKHKIRLFVIGFMLIILAPLCMQLLAQLYNGTTIGDKLVRMNLAISGGNVSEASGERSLNQIKALKLFLESPLWGNDILNNFTNVNIYHESHSTFLGVACSTGIIGLISYYSTYWSVIKPLFQEYSGKNKNYIAIVLYFFLFSILNPSESTEACWIIFMIVPLVYFISDKKMNIRIKKNV